MLQWLSNIIKQKLDESDLLLCIGTEAIFVGTYLIYPPASLILIGVLFLYLAVLHGKAEAVQARLF